jgi:RNA polymerase sigma-70 factor (ECF subfamily)
METSEMSEAEESSDLRDALRGDQAALARLLDRHRARLRQMIALRLDRRLNGRVDPSDVIQDAFLEAMAAMPRYAERAEMPFFLWLRWIAGMKLNAIHRAHLGFKVRDAAREVSIERGAWPQASSAAIAAQLLGHETSASGIAMRLERQARLHEALEGMDPVDREVLALRHFEQLTNAEVARSLDIQESTASKRYIRALRKLKEILGAMPGGTKEFRP